MCDKCIEPFSRLEKILTDKRYSTKRKIEAALRLAMWHRPGYGAAKYIEKAISLNADTTKKAL